MLRTIIRLVEEENGVRTWSGVGVDVGVGTAALVLPPPPQAASKQEIKRPYMARINFP